MNSNNWQDLITTHTDEPALAASCPPQSPIVHRGFPFTKGTDSLQRWKRSKGHADEDSRLQVEDVTVNVGNIYKKQKAQNTQKQVLVLQ